MRIYTSYYSHMKQIDDRDLCWISISASNPVEGMLQYKKLCPPYSLLMSYKNGELTMDQYIMGYIRGVLCKLQAREVVKELEELSNGKDVVLTCYEGPGCFCHRLIVSRWLLQNGFDVGGELK